MAGWRYARPLDLVAYPPNGAHEVFVAEAFVSASDGTGVVHMSPAFGADDYAAAQRNGLAFLQPVNLRGEFPAEIPLVGGLGVKAADPIIIPLSAQSLRATPDCIAKSLPRSARDAARQVTSRMPSSSIAMSDIWKATA